MVERLCLGTAQFGMDYGIANKRGKISKKEVFEILDYCRRKGMNTLDTASSYGESEKVIGEFTESGKCDFRIISKLPALEEFNTQTVKDILRASLERLNREDLHAYLIHRFNDFSKYGGLWGALEDLRKDGFVKKIGFSIYKTQELEEILEKGVDFGIIQVPYSIFDRRFEGHFGTLKKKGIEIHVRSVFLQGLVFLEPDSLPDGLRGARHYLVRMRNLAKEHNVSVSALCLSFVLANPCVDKLIIGVDSLDQLKRNIEGPYSIDRIGDICGGSEGLSIEDEDIILPYKWTMERYYA